VLHITIDEDRDVSPEDFDEDLSDVECSKEEKPREREIIDWTDDHQDAHDFDDEEPSESEDAISERSYDGSDADYYYELKEEREDRKREKGKAYSFENSKELEVQSAYDAMKLEKENSVALGLFDQNTSNNFRLYSTDWVQHCFPSCVHASPYVEFYDLSENYSRPLAEQETRQITGHLYINGSLDCDFKPFYPPQHASLDEFELQSNSDKYKLMIQFFSHDYVRLKVGQGFFFQKTPRPPKAPDFFEFVGIRRNWEKERLKREREAKKRKRSPSRCDSWFERTHYMGSWY
jgi:hypothetical protein